MIFSWPNNRRCEPGEGIHNFPGGPKSKRRDEDQCECGAYTWSSAMAVPTFAARTP